MCKSYDVWEVVRVFFAILLAVVARAADIQRLRLTGDGSPPPQGDVRDLLASICPHGIVPDPDLHGFSGCQTCPQFTTAPDWKNWTVAAIRHGHFSDPAAEEVAVATSGCEPHAREFGGTALFSHNGGKWKFKWYEAGVITNDCLMVRTRQGRDVLVCTFRDGHQGVLENMLFLIDFARAEGSRESQLLSLDDTMATCGRWGDSPDNIHPVQESIFREVAFDSYSAILRVELEYGLRRITPAAVKKCLDAQDANQPVPGEFQPAMKTYSLLYGFDGVTFHIQPGSRKDLATITSNRL